MKHRIVSGIIAGLTLAFAGAAVLFALGVWPGARATSSSLPAPIPHERTGGYAKCMDCHAAIGPSTEVPATHRAYADRTCTLCHQPWERTK
jgi:hypothetical protein